MAADSTAPSNIEGMEDGPATYEQLAQIELLLDSIDNRTLSIQNQLQAPIYEQRSAAIRKIPNFWSLVFEQAPPDIDRFIQPSDAAVFAACLKDITIVRFEVPSSLPADPYAPVTAADTHGGPWGEPRSLKFTFEFGENEWFEDKILEKKFWFRRAKDGWSGRVSEPVKIHWKKGKDLTYGLLDAVIKLHEAEKKVKAADGAAGAPGDGKGKEKAEDLPEAATVRKMLESSAGNLSFFNWFGFRGRSITVEESEEAFEKLSRGEKAMTSEDADVEDENEEEDLEDLEMDFETEIFPDGDELSVAIAEDLYPSAIRCFTQAQEEEDDLSDLEDLEDDMDDQDEDVDVPSIRSLVKDAHKTSGPPTKKRKT